MILLVENVDLLLKLGETMLVFLEICIYLYNVVNAEEADCNPSALFPQTSVSSSSRFAASQNRVSLSLDTLLMRQKYFRFTPALPQPGAQLCPGVAVVCRDVND